MEKRTFWRDETTLGKAFHLCPGSSRKASVCVLPLKTLSLPCHCCNGVAESAQAIVAGAALRLAVAVPWFRACIYADVAGASLGAHARARQFLRPPLTSAVQAEPRGIIERAEAMDTAADRRGRVERTAHAA